MMRTASLMDLVAGTRVAQRSVAALRGLRRGLVELGAPLPCPIDGYAQRLLFTLALGRLKQCGHAFLIVARLIVIENLLHGAAGQHGGLRT
jgi:hypothetical protein